jgi:hypothetical protein
MTVGGAVTNGVDVELEFPGGCGKDSGGGKGDDGINSPAMSLLPVPAAVLLTTLLTIQKSTLR